MKVEFSICIARWLYLHFDDWFI